MKTLRTSLLLTTLSAFVSAQAVDYPDSQLAAAPQLLFPFYTLGSGGVVRYQAICPSSFSGLPAQSTLVTRVGIPIAGQALYSQFEIRFGATTRQSLNNTWVDNLPDQRVQVDLSGTVLPGGLQSGQPATEWVEFDLAHPFVWNPGESLVLDIVSSAAAPGAWCMTESHSGERLYDAPYGSGPTGTSLLPSGAIKFRTVFDAREFPTYGQGCAGSGGFVPQISASGTTTAGSVALIQLADGLGGAPVGRLLGFSRQSAAFGSLPFAIGSNCDILNSVDQWDLFVASGTGAGAGAVTSVVIVPNDPTLVGTSAFFQFGVVDRTVPGTPVALSAGLIFHLR